MRFELLSPDITGIDFNNTLKYDEDFNIYTYRNFYNGGGVGLGDINNDGLLDIYMVSNMGANSLYLNLGNLKFKNITQESGTAGSKSWSTGVTLVDINADGFLDIYVCNSGDIKGDDKQNELFINQGDNTFIEKAKEYNLNDSGYGTHALFFDYDNDDDLDVYLLNNSYQAIGSFDLRRNERPKRDPEGGDKLLRNDNGKYVDVSEEAGIYGSVIGFGLGVTAGDINNDGWIDLFISNDFFEHDYIYINNGDGTFTESQDNYLKSMSLTSMGADMADINNDGRQDIFVTDMLPSDYQRYKSKTTFENWDKYTYNWENGYGRQYTRNALHLNNGANFSEIGRFAGVEATDWSWGALLADFDNDGLKDLFVSNGILKDMTDLDFITYISNKNVTQKILEGGKIDYKELIDLIPEQKIPNQIFKNLNGLKFDEKSSDWGLSTPSFSNGSAYGDLDNDGDLDLVINNNEMNAFVYENKTIQKDSTNFIKFLLKQPGSGNINAVGAIIHIWYNSNYQNQIIVPVRGFQSCSDIRANFGLGKYSQIDSVWVQWPDMSWQKVTSTELNNLNTIIKSETVSHKPFIQGNPSIEIFTDEVIITQHKENRFVDFDKDRLVYNMRSTEGPALSIGDINGDGISDFFLGGAKGNSSQIILGSLSGGYTIVTPEILFKLKEGEDVDAVLFDADNDNDLDIFIARGGREYDIYSAQVEDVLLLNDGKGGFSNATGNLPNRNNPSSSSSVDIIDFDLDGDYDLIIAERYSVVGIGAPSNIILLENTGHGKFVDSSNKLPKDLKSHLGMITDLKVGYINDDEYPDLVVVGEWMSPVILMNKNKGFIISFENKHELSGWYRSVNLEDINKDGKTDIILGNLGLNTRFQASVNQPLHLFINDFDKNGAVDHVFAQYQKGGKLYPTALRHDLVKQMPYLNKRFLKYNDFKNKTVQQIFGEGLNSAIDLSISNLSSGVLFQKDNGFKWKPFPDQAQFSTVESSVFLDVNNDGKLEILLGGNFMEVKPEIGAYDASFGTLLIYNHNYDEFEVIPNSITGLNLPGAVRDLKLLNQGGDLFLVNANNNGPLSLFRIETQTPSISKD
ncbi:VCBS repeat-containing protein [Flammeovirgaceae bacterium KN852]|uniref:VCBS repeat-containing protein n=1 Tax=Marinigracilibium pacificum TaxID=2729599 RepID=A0A848IXS4_9BACT|nr:VCBS repeat-containing protein [Marinigracilibium pacificum]NMM48085.1 VCBS repeat-containing protein [Marinigracilibium pacificum]